MPDPRLLTVTPPSTNPTPHSLGLETRGELRATLGDGKTGRELRAAALAGKTLGAGCIK